MKNKTNSKKSKKIAKITALCLGLLFFCGLVLLSFFNFFVFSPIDLTWLLEVPIAHRGLYNEQRPENSFLAFDNAIAFGYMIEFDVQLSKDGVPIVFHDDNTLRITGENKDIKETDFSSLEVLKLNDTDERIPTLEQALNFINGQVGVLIDIKVASSQNLNAILQVIEEYNGNYALQFINPLTFNWFSKRLTNIPLGMLYSSVMKIKSKPILNLRDNLYNIITKPNFISYNHLYVEKMNLNKHREKGLVILGYTFTQDELFQPQYNEYFDNIIFAFAQ